MKRGSDWDNTDVFEPTHRDNEPTWDFAFEDILILVGFVLFGLGLALGII